MNVSFNDLVDFDFLELLFLFMPMNMRCTCRNVCTLWRDVLDTRELVTETLNVAVIGTNQSGKSTLIARLIESMVPFPWNVLQERHEKWTSANSTRSKNSRIPLNLISDKTPEELSSNSTKHIKYHHILSGYHRLTLIDTPGVTEDSNSILNLPTYNIKPNKLTPIFTALSQSDATIIVLDIGRTIEHDQPKEIREVSRGKFWKEMIIDSLSLGAHQIVLCLFCTQNSRFQNQQTKAIELIRNNVEKKFGYLKTICISVVPIYSLLPSQYPLSIIDNNNNNNQSSREPLKYPPKQLKEMLNVLLPRKTPKEGPSRLYVDHVFSIDGNAVVRGRVYSNAFHLNQSVIIQPIGIETTICSIRINRSSVDTAPVNYVVSIMLANVSSNQIHRGYVIGAADQSPVPRLAKRVRVVAQCSWRQLSIGDTGKLITTGVSTTCRVNRILEILAPNSKNNNNNNNDENDNNDNNDNNDRFIVIDKNLNEKHQKITKHMFARLELVLQKPHCIEVKHPIRLGRFILQGPPISSLAVGYIDKILETDDKQQFKKAKPFNNRESKSSKKSINKNNNKKQKTNNNNNKDEDKEGLGIWRHLQMNIEAWKKREIPFNLDEDDKDEHKH